VCSVQIRGRVSIREEITVMRNFSEIDQPLGQSGAGGLLKLGPPRCFPVRLPSTPRGAVGSMGRFWGFWGASEPSNAMTCHNPAQDAPARFVCAVTEYWVALAWLGKMILAARNIRGLLQVGER
jgi:hypothetical protein